MRRCAALLCLCSSAYAAGGPFGAGVMIGEPSGLSFKLNLDALHAVDLALDFSLVDHDLYLHADYVRHFPAWMRGVQGGTWRPYLGLGGTLKVHDSGARRDHVGLRLPVGVAWSPRETPVDVFVEIVPGVRLLPATDPDLDAGVGVRYFF